MKAVHQPIIDETRDCSCATFHQYPLQAAPGKTVQNILRVKAIWATLKSHHIEPRCGPRRIMTLDDDNRCSAVLKQPLISGQFAATVYDDPGGTRACHLSHGKARIIILDGSDTDDDRINEGATTVKMRKPFRS